MASARKLRLGDRVRFRVATISGDKPRGEIVHIAGEQVIVKKPNGGTAEAMAWQVVRDG
tara:strand:+ start:3916 stop:4092 length:177 start_codon:yes stop_codon:yes gene_type:complete